MYSLSAGLYYGLKNEKYRQNVLVSKDVCGFLLGCSIIFQENKPLYNPVNKAVDVKACSLFEEGRLVSVLYQDVAPVMRENLFLAATEFYINTCCPCLFACSLEHGL